MAVRKLKFPLIINQGTGVTVSNSGVPFDGVTFLVQQLSIGQGVGTNSNVQFNVVSASDSILAGSTKFEDARVTGDFTVGGSLTVSGDLYSVPGNAIVGGTVTAEELLAEYNTSVAIFKSGSTQFGDSIDDDHIMIGSVYQSGSISLNEYTISEFSSDVLLADSSSISLPTENAVKNYVDTQGLYIDRQEYVRKSFSRKANSITNNTASFSAFSASAPTEMTSTSETDFIFFNNGQVMEHDALTIQQSGAIFMLKVNPSSIGYNLESADEIIGSGKFEATGYLKFDGDNDVVTTAFSSSGDPVDTTYSFWAKSSLTARNDGVFGHGHHKTSGFHFNFSNNRSLIWVGANTFTYFVDNSAQDDGEWHHWMLYKNVSGNITGSKLYVDGASLDVSNPSDNGNRASYIEGLSIGHDGGSVNYFTGSLKEFSVFSGDKTGNASTYYNNGTPYDVTNEDGLQAYWKLNENHSTIAYDSSGNGNNGTVDGATWSTLS